MSYEAGPIRPHWNEAMANAHLVENDLDLLPKSSADLRAELIRTFGEEWLVARNSWLEGRAPNQVIGTEEEYKVRDIFKSILVSALS